jgi:hypothetical protein
VLWLVVVPLVCELHIVASRLMIESFQRLPSCSGLARRQDLQLSRRPSDGPGDVKCCSSSNDAVQLNKLEEHEILRSDLTVETHIICSWSTIISTMS